MRFAHKLEFGEKTHEVSMTALRLVSRMKKDWMHYGRRPSGLCGAALLIASRLHGFHRSVYEVIKVVKVHESTLRKRLNEFGETPVSQLSLDEFINVDLDAMTEEQDPPSFKAARKRDKERLIQLEIEGDIDTEIGELEAKIADELDKMREKVMGKKYSKYARETSKNSQEQDVQDAFIAEQTLSSINELVVDKDKALMPPPTKTVGQQPVVGLGLKDTLQEYLVSDTAARKPDFVSKEDSDGELDLTGIDDDEIDGYLMSKEEIELKTKMWEKVNADYLKEKAEKEERERQEAQDGKEVKKRTRKTKDRKKAGGSATAIEAIEKIVQEKKISTKINYDVLRNLTLPGSSREPAAAPVVEEEEAPSPAKSIYTASPRKPSESTGRKRLPSFKHSPSPKKRRESETDSRELVVESGPIVREELPTVDEDDVMEEDALEEDDEDMSLTKLLSQHRGDQEDELYGGEEDYD